jgi:hypothetical protein
LARDGDWRFFGVFPEDAAFLVFLAETALARDGAAFCPLRFRLRSTEAAPKATAPTRTGRIRTMLASIPE